MKKKIYDVINIVLLSMMLVSCDCCEDSYVNIEYNLVCSSALLEYAVPQVTYTGSDGVPVTFTIPESAWEEAKDNKNQTFVIEINGDTISKSGNLVQWKYPVRYDDFSVVDDEMTVIYIPKPDIPTGKTAAAFPHQLSAKIDIRYEDGNESHPIEIDQSTSINIGETLSDIISNYRNYKGYHIESNGTFQVKRDK